MESSIFRYPQRKQKVRCLILVLSLCRHALIMNSLLSLSFTEFEDMENRLIGIWSDYFMKAVKETKLWDAHPSDEGVPVLSGYYK